MTINLNAPPTVRWLIRGDLARVLEIEAACFDNPLSEEDMLEMLRQRNCIGMVAVPHDAVLIADEFGGPMGFMIYELHRDHLYLLDFAVHPDYQRQGVGASMMHRIKSKLSQMRRHRIVARVSEYSDDAHLWLRRQGFIATGVDRNYWPGHDAYLFEFFCDE